MTAILRLLAPVLLALIAAGVLAWLCDRNGYARAKAHYDPILLQVANQAVAAEERAKAIEHAAAAVNAMISEEDKQRVETAQHQRNDALRRLADMRVRLASALTRRCEVPAVSSGAGEPAATGGDDERLRATDQRLADLARSCQRDADRLRGWQDWYQRQAAIAAAQPAARTP